MDVILFSTKCPRCIILEKKLKEKNITYTEINDVNVMTEKGFTTVPMLEVDGTVMDYKTAFNYVESL
jgi:glutaredoxin